MSQTDTMEAMYESFNKSGIILVHGVFDSVLAEYAAVQTKRTVESARDRQQDYATVLFDAVGSHARTLQHFISAMHYHRPNADFRYIGCVYARAKGSAFDLLQYCDWRVAYSGSELKIEFGPVVLENSDLATLHTSPARAMMYERARIREFLAMHSRRSGLPIEKIRRISIGSPFMTATQAHAYGFLDEVIDCLPGVSIRPTYHLQFVIPRVNSATHLSDTMC